MNAPIIDVSGRQIGFESPPPPPPLRIQPIAHLDGPERRYFYRMVILKYVLQRHTHSPSSYLSEYIDFIWAPSDSEISQDSDDYYEVTLHQTDVRGQVIMHLCGGDPHLTSLVQQTEPGIFLENSVHKYVLRIPAPGKDFELKSNVFAWQDYRRLTWARKNRKKLQ